MDITAIQNTTMTAGTTATAEAASTPTLDYNAFLHLLIAQMRNQDPMEPMKSSDYVAQLATFSQVEKTIQTNERIASLLNTNNLQLAESLIGKTVISSENNIGGVVVAAKVMSNGVMVLLDNGAEFMVGPGLIIGEGASPPPAGGDTQADGEGEA
ncbi:MAG: flagellar hook assembly protein FlgD [Hyphomicrobiaceae bacterium]